MQTASLRQSCTASITRAASQANGSVSSNRNLGGSHARRQRWLRRATADAFEIIGHDRDAVPEYLGVWEWGDLELDECCPLCGAMCGMHFQEASQAYHCISCGRLSDFSDQTPDFDTEEEYRTWLADNPPPFPPGINRFAILGGAPDYPSIFAGTDVCASPSAPI